MARLVRVGGVDVCVNVMCGHTWDESEMCEAGTPARMARSISYPLLASMCRPMLLKSCRGGVG